MINPMLNSEWVKKALFRKAFENEKGIKLLKLFKEKGTIKFISEEETMNKAEDICECPKCGNADGKRYQIDTLSTCGDTWELEQKCLDCGRTMTIHAIVESVTVTHKGR